MSKTATSPRSSWIKLLRVGILVSLLAAVIAGCGGTTSPQSGDDSPSGDAAGDQLQPVTIRLASDVPPPPQPIAIAMNQFAEDLPERIPGSEVRVYFAGALYSSVSDALEAMDAGNLELLVGQPSKSAGFEPWLNIITQPMSYTTVGAIHHFPGTETAKMIEERMEEKGIKILGWADISFYLGVAASERLLTLDDFKGKKLRIFAPLTQGPTVEAWGASPVSLAWGEVPSALAAGTIDGAVTTISGYNTIKDQTPYYTIMGVGGMSTDFYYIAASKQWWDSLNPATQAAIQEVVDEMVEYGKVLQWCQDQLVLASIGTDDPSEPGVYVMSEEEQEPLRAALGDAVIQRLTQELPENAAPWITKFTEEGAELSAQYPAGSDPLESVDCSEYKSLVLPD